MSDENSKNNAKSPYLTKIPEGEVIVSMIKFRDHALLATDKGVYQLNEKDRFLPVMFEITP